MQKFIRILLLTRNPKELHMYNYAHATFALVDLLKHSYREIIFKLPFMYS